MAASSPLPEMSLDEVREKLFLRLQQKGKFGILKAWMRNMLYQDMGGKDNSGGSEKCIGAMAMDVLVLEYMKGAGYHFAESVFVAESNLAAAPKLPLEEAQRILTNIDDTHSSIKPILTALHSIKKQNVENQSTQAGDLSDSSSLDYKLREIDEAYRAHRLQQREPSTSARMSQVELELKKISEEALKQEINRFRSHETSQIKLDEAKKYEQKIQSMQSEYAAKETRLTREIELERTTLQSRSHEVDLSAIHLQREREEFSSQIRIKDGTYVTLQQDVLQKQISIEKVESQVRLLTAEVKTIQMEKTEVQSRLRSSQNELLKLNRELCDQQDQHQQDRNTWAAQRQQITSQTDFLTSEAQQNLLNRTEEIRREYDTREMELKSDLSTQLDVLKRKHLLDLEEAKQLVEQQVRTRLSTEINLLQSQQREFCETMIKGKLELESERARATKQPKSIYSYMPSDKQRRRRKWNRDEIGSFSSLSSVSDEGMLFHNRKQQINKPPRPQTQERQTIQAEETDEWSDQFNHSERSLLLEKQRELQQKLKEAEENERRVRLSFPSASSQNSESADSIRRRLLDRQLEMQRQLRDIDNGNDPTIAAVDSNTGRDQIISNNTTVAAKESDSLLTHQQPHHHQQQQLNHNVEYPVQEIPSSGTHHTQPQLKPVSITLEEPVVKQQQTTVSKNKQSQPDNTIITQTTTSTTSSTASTESYLAADLTQQRPATAPAVNVVPEEVVKSVISQPAWSDLNKDSITNNSDQENSTPQSDEKPAADALETTIPQNQLRRLSADVDEKMKPDEISPPESTKSPHHSESSEDKEVEIDISEFVEEIISGEYEIRRSLLNEETEEFISWSLSCSEVMNRSLVEISAGAESVEFEVMSRSCIECEWDSQWCLMLKSMKEGRFEVFRVVAQRAREEEEEYNRHEKDLTSEEPVDFDSYQGSTESEYSNNFAF